MAGQAEFFDLGQPTNPLPSERFVEERSPPGAGSPMSQMFPQNNYREVIQEYTKEDRVVSDVKDKFWGINSKSLVLGFNEKDDALDYQDLQDMSRVWDIMKDPEEDFTWDRGQDYHQITFLLKARVNRSILRPNGGTNERTAQNTQITQSINSTSVRQGTMGGSGFVNDVKNAIGRVLN